ncbi:MAG: hypothetical protein ACJA0S_001361 [Rickettsiales bacterium]|jgi:hypothetical protein
MWRPFFGQFSGKEKSKLCPTNFETIILENLRFGLWMRRFDIS